MPKTTSKTHWSVSVLTTEDQAKVLAHQIPGHKDTIEDYEEQLSSTDERIVSVQESISELEVSVAKATARTYGSLRLFTETLPRPILVSLQLRSLLLGRLTTSSSCEGL